MLCTAKTSIKQCRQLEYWGRHFAPRGALESFVYLRSTSDTRAANGTHPKPRCHWCFPCGERKKTTPPPKQQYHNHTTNLKSLHESQVAGSTESHRSIPAQKRKKDTKALLLITSTEVQPASRPISLHPVPSHRVCTCWTGAVRRRCDRCAVAGGHRTGSAGGLLPTLSRPKPARSVGRQRHKSDDSFCYKHQRIWALHYDCNRLCSTAVDHRRPWVEVFRYGMRRTAESAPEQQAAFLPRLHRAVQQQWCTKAKGPIGYSSRRGAAFRARRATDCPERSTIGKGRWTNPLAAFTTAATKRKRAHASSAALRRAAESPTITLLLNGRVLEVVSRLASEARRGTTKHTKRTSGRQKGKRHRYAL